MSKDISLDEAIAKLNADEFAHEAAVRRRAVATNPVTRFLAASAVRKSESAVSDSHEHAEMLADLEILLSRDPETTD